MLYAWINLDSTKLTKLDAVSEAELRKEGRLLELLLNSGNLYFNVNQGAQPQMDDLRQQMKDLKDRLEQVGPDADAQHRLDDAQEHLRLTSPRLLCTVKGPPSRRNRSGRATNLTAGTRKAEKRITSIRR